MWQIRLGKLAYTLACMCLAAYLWSGWAALLVLAATIDYDVSDD